MIAGLKPYPVMKDSGVPWLGRVPDHWSVNAMRHRYQQCLGKMLDSKRIRGDASVPYLRNIDVQWDHINVDDLPVMDITADEYERYCVRPGDLLVCEGGEVGRAAIWNGRIQRCGYQKALHRLRPYADALDSPRFLYYVFRSASSSGAFLDGHESTISHLTGDKLRSHRFAFPPLVEQQAIVRLLEHAERRIHRYIRAKQKLIKLLEEQKQAIIHRAVTRGLDPNVRHRSSGVGRLDDVPEHWELRRLKTLVQRIDQGVSPQAENALADIGSWGVLKAGCVNRGIFRETEHKRLPAAFRIDSDMVVADGDVLVSRASGSSHFVGSVGRVLSLNYSLILSDKTFRPIFNQRVDPDFMVLAMNSLYYRQQVEQAISGAEGLANNLPLSSLRTFVFAIPPLAEQRTIVHEVRESVSELLDAVDRTEREISLLREYRTRLIADVVTGKLDVREAAARLPDEPEDTQAPDETEGVDDTDGEVVDDLDAAAEEADA